MKNSQQKNSIKLLYYLSKYFYGFVFAISAIFSTFLIYVLFGGGLEESLTLGSGLVESSLDFEDFYQISPFVRSLVLLCMIATLFLFVAILYFWNRFMTSIYNGDYFEFDTIKNLKFISYLMSASWLFITIIELMINDFVSFTESTSSEVSSLVFSGSFNVTSLNLLFGALIFWVLSHVLMEGIKINEENKLII